MARMRRQKKGKGVLGKLIKHVAGPFVGALSERIFRRPQQQGEGRRRKRRRGRRY